MNQPRAQVVPGLLANESFSNSPKAQLRSVEIPVTMTATGNCVVAPNGVKVLSNLLVSAASTVSKISGPFELTYADQSRKATGLLVVARAEQLEVVSITSRTGEAIQADRLFVLAA